MLRMDAGGRHAAIVRELELPVPFDLGQFVAGLERQRNRVIQLRPFSSGPDPIRPTDRYREGRVYLPRGKGHSLQRYAYRAARDREEVRSMLRGILGFLPLVLNLAGIFLGLALNGLSLALSLLAQTHDRLLSCYAAPDLPYTDRVLS